MLPEVAEALLLKALDLGVTLFDTAALYGFGANETLVGRVLAPHRSKVTLASKCGMTGVNGMRVIDGRPDTLRRTCEESLQRLRTDVIDLYYLHRWDKKVPIEDSVGALADLVRAGKVRAIGLSEVSAATLRRAHAVHPITALQTEYSLWTRNPGDRRARGLPRTRRRLRRVQPGGARGFLTGKLRDVSSFDPKDIRRGMPRFQARKLRREPEAARRLHRTGQRSRLHAGAARAGLAARERRAHRADPGHDERRAPRREPRCRRGHAGSRPGRAARRADQPPHGGRPALQRETKGRDTGGGSNP